MMQMSFEYYLPMTEAEHIVQEFMNVTVRELKSVKCSKFIDRIIDDIVSKERLPSEEVQDMTYMELVCLIDHVKESPQYGRSDHDSMTRQAYYYLNLARALIEAGTALQGQGSKAVESFQKLPIEQFYAYLESANAGKDMSSEFTYIRNCCEYEDFYTILDFLMEKLWLSDRPWRMAEPLNEFGERIRNFSKDIGRLLVDSFHMAFPDRFHAVDICSKYHDSGEDERKDGLPDNTEPGDDPFPGFHEVFSDEVFSNSPRIPGTNIPRHCYRALHIADSTIEGDRSAYLQLLAPMPFAGEVMQPERRLRQKLTAEIYTDTMKLLNKDRQSTGMMEEA